jgi:hypothetical protein
MAVHAPGKQHKPLPAQAKQLPTQEVPAQQPPAQPTKPVQLARKVDLLCLAVTVTVPLAGSINKADYRQRHLTADLDSTQAGALKRLVVALDFQQEKLASGRRVVSSGDAVRWLLEQLADPLNAAGR